MQSHDDAALAFGLCLSLATGVIAASAAEAQPRIAPLTPYLKARVELIRQGFDPVRILDRGPPLGTSSQCRPAGPDATPCLPELMECGGPAWSCEWLFVRRSDGVLFRVVTHNEGEGWGAGETPRVMEISSDLQGHLKGYVIAKARRPASAQAVKGAQSPP